MVAYYKSDRTWRPMARQEWRVDIDTNRARDIYRRHLAHKAGATRRALYALRNDPRSTVERSYLELPAHLADRPA